MKNTYNFLLIALVSLVSLGSQISFADGTQTKGKPAILILGRSGTAKSTIANLLYHHQPGVKGSQILTQPFTTCENPTEPCTKQITVHESPTLGWSIIDTPIAENWAESGLDEQIRSLQKEGLEIKLIVIPAGSRFPIFALRLSKELGLLEQKFVFISRVDEHDKDAAAYNARYYGIQNFETYHCDISHSKTNVQRMQDMLAKLDTFAFGQGPSNNVVDAPTQKVASAQPQVDTPSSFCDEFVELKEKGANRDAELQLLSLVAQGVLRFDEHFVVKPGYAACLLRAGYPRLAAAMATLAQAKE